MSYGRQGICHFCPEFGFVDHNEMPRLGIACRRRTTGCVDNAHHHLARHAALRVVATVALTLVNKFIKIGHRLF